MKDYVYCLYNKLSSRYEGVMSFASDGMALHRLNSSIDKEQYELCRVGAISIETGVIQPCPPVRLVWDTKENNELPTREEK